MLNFIYWPISAVLWFWHKVFSFVLNPDSGITWVLAIIFLTFTIKALLVRPTINQLRSGRKMQEMQPKMQEIRQKYKNDQQKLMEETRKLQKEMGVNPIAGCLPMLVQIPVFIGLFHVLRSFNRTGEGMGQLGLSIEENYNTPNYIFGVEEVQSFLDATLFGVPLSAYLSMPESMYAAFPNVDFGRMDIAFVAVPLVLIIAVATHFNARMSIERQQARIASGKQAKPTGDNAEMMQNQMQMMNKMMMWVMPATILFTGFLWHIGLLFYMVSNNIWTFFQNRWAFAKMDAEEAAEEEARKVLKRTTAPAPGARPTQPKKKKKKNR
ncbi:membrane protein insertase YidC [Corynebacterium halotolerans]|uniref:Membrane protein insertase YidC n=1 Tax=Corynebacterium halotolerans YIM 70093 = DSM 44683 TaxID=1121362 RepID=M1PAU9_9CORY|nr:membrane protein insertase YidC [Corynebacterium halotolerans]AGF73806.1 putative inner membrane protein translocase component YidC [Corynebacterium halotolerans YIM 70093 = DSM 44683]